MPPVARLANSSVNGREAVPLFIGQCFAWLHYPIAGRASDTAILICPPVSWDALHSHHTLRLLADTFAALGYPALRFSYPSTGDSGEVQAELWTAWQGSLNDAADWLRQNTGASRIVLAGLRLGATLAVLAAETRGDVAGLLLMAPVLRGHSYMRQLAIEAQLQNGWSSKDGSLEFLELCFGPATAGLIRRVDLRRARLRPGVSVAIFQPAPSRIVDQCAQAWAGDGLEIVRGGFRGLEAMLLPTIDADPPPTDFRAVTQWLQMAIPIRASVPFVPLKQTAALALPDCVETPLCFDSGARLFGILCEPRHTTSDLAVLIVNTGRDPHYGIARFGVEFGRRLATAGTASFRFDFAGLGDSPGPRGSENALGALFETCRTADISAAIDALQRRGYRRFAVHGVCSGAHHGFHAALADERITTLLLVNFLVFDWRPLRLAELPMHYAKHMLRFSTWTRLLRADPTLIASVRSLCERLWHKAIDALAPFDIPWLQSLEQRSMAALSARGVRTLFLFAKGEPGAALVQRALGGNEARRRGVAIIAMPELDHVLTGRAMRQSAADAMIRFLALAPDGSGTPART